MVDFAALPKDVRLLIAKRLSIDARIRMGVLPGRVQPPACVRELPVPDANFLAAARPTFLLVRIQLPAVYTLQCRAEYWTSVDNVTWVRSGV